ncbi:MAG: RES family NAD+ phosphorylase [Longimicrobiaceae bacterium]
MTFSGRVWRHVPRGAHALHLGFILEATGRWNRQGEYGCLYTALTPAGALAEYRKHLVRNRLQKPRDLVSIEVTVRPVLDLTELAIQARYAASLEKMTGDSDEELEQCRQLADAARGEGFRAILAPSAAQEGERVLVIYPEGRASDLRLREGPDRLAVNHGPTPLVDEHGEVIGQI